MEVCVIRAVFCFCLSWEALDQEILRTHGISVRVYFRKKGERTTYAGSWPKYHRLHFFCLVVSFPAFGFSIFVETSDGMRQRTDEDLR